MSKSQETREPPDLRKRITLRRDEAAAALGLSERTFSCVAPSLPRLWAGRIPLYPVRALEDWAIRNARTDGEVVDAVVEDVLGSISAGSEED